MAHEWSRRQLLQASSRGLGSLLSAGLFADLAASGMAVPDQGNGSGAGPLAPKLPHYTPKAKRVILLYMSGGASHLETFDPKPQLDRDHGKTMVPEEGREYGGTTVHLKKSIFKFQRYGQCGMEVSEIFPYISGCVDDICLIRSMTTDHLNHYESALGLHCGSFNVTRPSIGAWVSYGLGTENQNLPAVMVIAPHLPYAGNQLWTADFLPAYHQGTRVVPGEHPIADLQHHGPVDLQSLQLQMLAEMNRRHLQTRSGETAGLAARMQTFETAFGMQTAAPDIFDLSQESAATLQLYGLESAKSTAGFAWQCLVARRLAERGVRFIELIDTGSTANWDSHGNMQNHAGMAKNVDQPIAALLKDLKMRGMLDETLVVWTTEFGRPPYEKTKGAKGRGHHHPVFSSWLAGGGVKGGMIHGASDEYGYAVAENPVHINDFHATVLHLMGLDHTRLTYRHAGRDFRLTDVGGNVVDSILT